MTWRDGSADDRIGEPLTRLLDMDVPADIDTGRVAHLALVRLERHGRNRALIWRIPMAFAGLIVTLVLVVYLAGPEESVRVAASPSTVQGLDQFAALLAGTQFDYEPSDSPRELASWMDGVVIGTFESVADGYVEYLGGDVPVNHAIFALRVDDVIRGSASELLTDGRVYLDFTRAANTSVEAFRAAVPSGRVLLFIAKYTLPPGRYENEQAGRPEGADLFFVPPEGLWVEGENGDVPILLDFERPNRPRWGEVDTIEEIANALRG